jgi:hypothetical protein
MSGIHGHHARGAVFSITEEDMNPSMTPKLTCSLAATVREPSQAPGAIVYRTTHPHAHATLHQLVACVA